MKYIVGDLIGEKVNIDDCPILALVVEEPRSYFELCSYAYSGFRGKNGFLSFVEGDKEIEPEYVENLFWPDLNTKRNLNALYKRLKQFGSDDLEGKLKAVCREMESIVLAVSMDFDGELICAGNLKPEDLFKIFDLRFSEDDTDGFARLVRYISLCHELSKTSVFCLRGLHQCFTGKQIVQLEKELEYKKVTVITFESFAPKTTSSFERVLIVDKDLCSIG